MIKSKEVRQKMIKESLLLKQWQQRKKREVEWGKMMIEYERFEEKKIKKKERQS